MILELKHLAPYLPYGLKMETTRGIDNLIGITFSDDNDYEDVPNPTNPHNIGHPLANGEFQTWDFKEVTPLLLPLSDLKSEKYINMFFDKDTFMDEITGNDNQIESANNFIGRFKITDNDYCYPYDFFANLFKYHFDVFGLIESGLAINKSKKIKT